MGLRSKQAQRARGVARVGRDGRRCGGACRRRRREHGGNRLQPRVDSAEQATIQQ